MAARIKTLLGHFQNSDPTVDFVSSPAVHISPSTEDFRFTVPNKKLSQDQRRFYEKNGFLVIKNLVPHDKLDEYAKRFEKLCTKDVPAPLGMTIMRDVAISKSEFVPGQKAITKIQNFEGDEVMFDYCQRREVLDYVECILGANIMSMHTMLINKPPDPGLKSSRHPMHQDLHYFPFRPADRIVCSWTAMEHVHRQNGCLVVMPGSHTGQLLEHGYPEWEGGVNKLYHGIKNYDPTKPRIHLEMEKGDTVFFHPLLIHGSGMNRTKGFRKSISCHYASSDCHYIDVKGTTQHALAQESMAVFQQLSKKLTGTDVTPEVDYSDAWRFKSRLVRGDNVNLH